MRRFQPLTLLGLPLALVAPLAAQTQPGTSGQAPTPKAQVPRIAVLPFEGGQGAEQEEVGTALQAMVITDLAAVPGLKLLERARIKDLLAEQELGLSGALDPATAAQTCKLLGATHLLVGRCTVVGAKMRLDARLLRAQAGDVVVAAAIEGEKEAFFELEKDLVNRLITAMGVKLLPKERAEVAKVHTADYEAFRTFGKGLRLYDAKQVEPALAALREAMAKDRDFKLAALTLDEYQRILTTLRTQADDLLVAQASLERAKRDQAAAAEAALVERLETLARSTDREDRLTALHSLAVAFGNVGGRQNKLLNLRRVEDRFAFRRQADAAAARYVTEALAAFPAAPLTVDESRYAHGLTEHPEDFDKEWAWAKKRLLGVGDIEENRRNAVLDSTRYVETTAAMMLLDSRQTVAFHQQLFDQSLTLKPSDYHVKEGRETLAKQWRQVLELDKSTALLAELSRGTDNPWALKGLASEVEQNRDLAKLLAESPTPSLVREYLLLLGHDGGVGAAKSLFGPEKTPTLRAQQELTRQRKWPHESFLWVGDQPCWSLNGDFFLHTGPRADLRRTEELRVWHPADRLKDPEPLLILGASPRGNFTASFTLGFTVPPDFQPRQGEGAAGPARPEVTFLFGVQDVDCDRVEDPATKKTKLVRPLKGYGVVLAEGAVKLVTLVESDRDMWGRKTAFQVKELGAKALDLGADRLPVTVKVNGHQVFVEAGGRKAAFALPSPATGYAGLRVAGPGYVSLAGLKVTVPKG
ncbi:MAG TPA: CsgG/HfaB family protein [Holophagaceae bacterium]|nr:CsgG/HfaB family protein [Holophagaceae bacterium]